jgi:hypothetical protein
MTTPRAREAFLTLAAGTIAGLLVLGIGGRLLMAALVLLMGGRPDFTAGGSLKVVLVGTGYGALGGLLLLPLRRVVGERRLLSGPLLGLVLLGVGWLTSPVGRAAGSGPGSRVVIVLALAMLAFIAYGVATDALLGRWLPRQSRFTGAAA